MNNPFLAADKYPVVTPILVPTEEELINERVKKRQDIRFLRNYAETSRNKELKECIYNLVGQEPSGLRKPCANVNNVIDRIIRSKYDGMHMTTLNAQYGINLLLMVKVIAYSKFEHRIIIKYDEQSNKYFWIPTIEENNK